MFVAGSVNMARWARWPTAVIGVTVAAFGTSSPELMVAIQAAMHGVPEISLGDVLGSNVANVAMVLAIVLAMAGMKVEDPGVKRDWISALLAPVVLGLILWDGWFSRYDAIVLLGVFLFWLVTVLKHARAHARRNPPEEGRDSPRLGDSLLRLTFGLLMLIAAARFVVVGGTGLAELLGWSPFVVGAVVVGVATSVPELATSLISRIKGHDDVGMGNILGSNVFNVLFIAAIAALIRPYRVDLGELLPSLAFGMAAVLLIFPGKNGKLRRWRGSVLLLVYAGFLFVSTHSQ